MEVTVSKEKLLWLDEKKNQFFVKMSVKTEEFEASETILEPNSNEISPNFIKKEENFEENDEIYSEGEEDDFDESFVKSEENYVKQELIGNNDEFIVSVKPSDFFNENEEENSSNQYLENSSDQFLENSSNQDPLNEEEEDQKDSFQGLILL